ncbi:MAG: hypothetical protein M0C28_25405 [Candidatus Moduliflexus flocculans]|nr:hypothetical protein [Candidatus Moduliflexus flocculans]
MSSADELAMGQQTNPQILRTYGKYEDADLARYVAALGEEIGRFKPPAEAGLYHPGAGQPGRQRLRRARRVRLFDPGDLGLPQRRSRVGRRRGP